MKAERKTLATRKPQDSQSTELKAVMPATRVPLPHTLTREETRKIMIDQIG
jgi:hypothetical protein